MSWEPCYVVCGREGDHPVIRPAGNPGVQCLICQLEERNQALTLRIRLAAQLLHEGKVVQAHEALTETSPDQGGAT